MTVGRGERTERAPRQVEHTWWAGQHRVPGAGAGAVSLLTPVAWKGLSGTPPHLSWPAVPPRGFTSLRARGPWQKGLCPSGQWQDLLNPPGCFAP